MIDKEGDGVVVVDFGGLKVTAAAQAEEVEACAQTVGWLRKLDAWGFNEQRLVQLYEFVGRLAAARRAPRTANRGRSAVNASRTGAEKARLASCQPAAL